MERLDDVVVGAGPQALHPLDDVGLGGQKQDRDALAGCLGTTDLGDGLVAIHAGQDRIDEDQIGGLLRHQGDARLAVSGEDDVKPLLLEGEVQDALDVEVVIDDQDLDSHGPSREPGRSGRSARPGRAGL